MTPDLIAHRGASRERLENTLGAFARALELGADGIELDVHATADRVVVVHHDPVLKPGEGAAGGEPESIASLSAAALLRRPLADGSFIPTLDEVLDRVGVLAAVYVEVKAAGIEHQVVQTIQRHATRCEVHSFDHRVAAAARAIDRRLPVGVLSASYPIHPVAALRDAGASSLWQECSLIDEPLVQAAHDAGARVIAWTVNDGSLARSLRDMGVDGLCGDDITLLRTALA